MTAPFLIVVTGQPVASMRRHGSFAHWIRVAAGLERDEAVVVDVAGADGHGGDELPTREGFAGVIVTGSAAMVTERRDWSERSAGWLREDAHAGMPLLGICYGHQLIAHALGGEVGYNPGGREMGTVHVDLHPPAAADPLFAGLPPRFPAQANTERHQDDRLSWGDAVWGLQFHPEFSTGHMRGYIRARSEALASEGRCGKRLAREVSAAPQARRVLRRFVRHARGSPAG